MEVAMYEFKHDQAAALVFPVKNSLMALIDRADCARGHVEFDGTDFIEIGETRLVVDGDSRVGYFVADLVNWFMANSGTLVGCLDDHVRLEALIDPELPCTGVLLPEELVKKYEDQDPPMRPVIDEAIGWISENMTLNPEEAEQG